MLTGWILSKIFYIKPAIIGNELDHQDSTKYPSYICCGSSKSYSPRFLSDAYSPSRERKSGIPHETPLTGRKDTNIENQKGLNTLMPAPVNIKMRCDF